MSAQSAPSSKGALNAQRPRDYDPQPIRGVLPVRSSGDRSPATAVVTVPTRNRDRLLFTRHKFRDARDPAAAKRDPFRNRPPTDQRPGSSQETDAGSSAQVQRSLRAADREPRRTPPANPYRRLAQHLRSAPKAQPRLGPGGHRVEVESTPVVLQPPLGGSGSRDQLGGPAESGCYSSATSMSSRQWSLGPQSSTELRARTLTLWWKPRDAKAQSS